MNHRGILWSSCAGSTREPDIFTGWSPQRLLQIMLPSAVLSALWVVLASPGEEKRLNNRRSWTSALVLAATLIASVSLIAGKARAEGGTQVASSGSTALYKLPWTGGASYPVIQEYNKHFDFRLPLGTQVRAARGGTVYVKRASEDRGCCDPSCSFYDNYVRITHDDGSYGFYQHLQYGSITVDTGDTVAQGDCLGLSGATGYVCGLSGQHLHFNVNTNPFNSGGVPYGIAFTEIAFAEGPIPSGGAYSPSSQNSTSWCGFTPAPTATPTPSRTAPGIYLPLTMRGTN